MDYCGLNAKVLAMKGKLLKKEDYENLSLLKTVDDVNKKLLEYPDYEKALKNDKAESIRREQLEHKLMLPLYYDFIKIYNFIKDYNVRSCLESLFLKYEINILINLLTYVYDERESVYSLPELKYFLNNKSNIDAELLLTSTTVSQFIENLKGSVFYAVLSRAYENDKSIFELSMALNLYYYMQLHKSLKLFDKDNKTVLRGLYGVETDVTNITWVYRLKKYFKMQAQEIYTYLIPVHHLLSAQSLMRMAEAVNVEEMINEIKTSHYGSCFSGSIELFHYAAMAGAYGAAKHKTNTLAITFSYLFYKEMEINNITSLLEGVRYSLTSKEIMKYIILPGKEAKQIDRKNEVY